MISHSNGGHKVVKRKFVDHLLPNSNKRHREWFVELPQPLLRNHDTSNAPNNNYNYNHNHNLYYDNARDRKPKQIILRGPYAQPLVQHEEPANLQSRSGTYLAVHVCLCLSLTDSF